jgi:superfamily II DNA or RNA helicase
MTNCDEYFEFCRSKKVVVPEVGFDPGELSGPMFPFQREAVRTALKRGRCALFEDCGLGKSIQALTFAHEVSRHTNKPALIVSPLGVAKQTVREGEKFALPVSYAENQHQVNGAVTVTNYDRLDGFDASQFSCVIPDESSVLKNFSGNTKRKLVSKFAPTPYKLCCSATPSPNDYIELGNHAEFLGVMKSRDMLTRWFVQAPDKNQKMKLKGHSVEDFWDWVSSWAIMLGKPSDLSSEYNDDGYVLPKLSIVRHVLDVDVTTGRSDGMLIRVPNTSSIGIHREKRMTIDARVAEAKKLIEAEPNEPWIVWADTDYDADALKKALPGICNVRGSDKQERKEGALLGFTTGEPLWMLTKPKLAGLGMNFQHCARIISLASTYSFEQWYQSIRRCWRFGQNREVIVHMIYGATESHVIEVLEEKRNKFADMQSAMFEAMRRRQRAEECSGKYVPIGDLTFPNWLKSEER